ncbi:MAG: DUF6600 domain-containing protein [Candidatus Saccharicenans sp.]
MKRIILVLSLIFLTAGCLVYLPYNQNQGQAPGAATYETPQAYGEVTMSYIYGYLGQFGFWVEYQPYGYVWVPSSVPIYWRPYTNGRWIWTDYGWTWYSYFEWGWLPFHYGRWSWNRDLGWFWVPDVVWAPAWVAWRIGDFYLGWAPLPPGVEFSFDFGLRWPVRGLPDSYWIFIEARRFQENNLSYWILPPERNLTIINFTSLRDKFTIRNRRTIIDDAIRPEEIERIGRIPITRVKLKEVKQPTETGVGIDNLRIYRPEIARDKTTPKNILNRDELEQKLKPLREAEKPENLEEIHSRQKTLLENTQKMEIENLKKQVQEQVKASPPEERQKKLSELQAKIEELKKKHDLEKRQLVKRQSEEKQQVKRGQLKKKSDSGY